MPLDIFNDDEAPLLDTVSRKAEGDCWPTAGRNIVFVSELPALIGQVHQSLSLLQSGAQSKPEAVPLRPAVPIRKSVTPDFIVSLTRTCYASIAVMAPSRRCGLNCCRC